MESKDKKVLQVKFGLTLLKILEQRKEKKKSNELQGIKDHKLISSLRKLSAASGIDFGTIQKISRGYQGLEFFTFIDIIDALEIDIVSFGEYFNSITNNEVKIEMEKRTGKKKVKKN